MSTTDFPDASDILDVLAAYDSGDEMPGLTVYTDGEMLYAEYSLEEGPAKKWVLSIEPA